jgi:hypothetical protein
VPAAPWLALLLALLAGCQPPAAGPGPAAQAERAANGSLPVTESAAKETETAFEEPPPDDLDGGELVEETWDAYSMQGQGVGYCRTTIAKVMENGQALIRTSGFTRTVMKRSGQTISTDMVMTSWDTDDGRFVRFESRMSGSPSDNVSVGAVANGQLGIDISTLGRTQSHRILWPADWGGLFAPEQSLRRQPLKPGEKRTIRSLLPIFNLPGDTHLDAGEYEMVELPSGKTKLLKVKSVVEIAGQKIESLSWVNERGETLKSTVPSIGQEAVRTAKQQALRQKSGGQFDLLVASTVPLKGRFGNGPATKRVVYRARMKDGPIQGLFAESLSQRVKLLDEQSAEITVLAVRPNRPPTPDIPQPKPTDADSAPNNFIQSDDRQIVEIASRLAPGESDPWKLACVLESFVDQTVELKNFSQAFATAAEVARSREGDCTEHGVLMAALCRARKIPARVAFGLVYFEPEKGFAYHMWNEVWIADRWVPVDATLGLGGIGADHIKLGDSNLSGGSPLADLLTVIQVFGRLELEVKSVE